MATRPQKLVLPPSTRARTQEEGLPVGGCSFSLTTQFRVKLLPAYDSTFLYLASAGLPAYGRSRKLYSATWSARWSGGSRERRGEAYGHSIVRYSARWSIMRPA